MAKKVASSKPSARKIEGNSARKSAASKAKASGLGPVKVAGVIGLGYVGLPLAIEMARAGFKVIGFDIDKKKVAYINSGKSHITDVEHSEVEKYTKSGLFEATVDFDRLTETDAISICVPTPLRKTKDPDVSFIDAAAKEVVPRLKKGQLIILESTSYPGTTDDMLLAVLEKAGHVAGKDFFLAFSPERVDPGNVKYKTKNTPKVIGGVTKACNDRVREFYGAIFDKVVPVSSTRSAEMVKLLENTFRAVNIGLVNEVALMCNKLDLDVWEVIEAASTKPFGFMAFFPGPGLGGHCIPIDPLYLSWKLKALNYTARFIELASEINSSMPQWVVTRTMAILNERKKAVNGSRVLILGAAYKKNVTDVRESPALDIIHLLHKAGARVEYYDPHVPVVKEGSLELKSLKKLTPAQLRKADIVLIVTNHDCFDIPSVVKHAKLIFDTRNATQKTNRKVVKL